RSKGYRRCRKRRGPLSRPSGWKDVLPTRLVPAVPAAPACLHGGLECASCLEFRHRRGRNLNLLARARVHTHARRTALCRELAEAGEVHLASARELSLDCVEECLDGLARVALGQPCLCRHPIDELLLGHAPTLLGIRDASQRNRRIGLAQPCAFCWPFAAAATSLAVYNGHMRTAWRARASIPPSSRSTTQTPLRPTRPASPRPSTQSTA